MLALAVLAYQLVSIYICYCPQPKPANADAFIIGVEIADFTLPTCLDDMFKFCRRQLGEQTAEDEAEDEIQDEVVTDSCRQEMDKEEIDQLKEFVTVVDNEDNVDFS